MNTVAEYPRADYAANNVDPMFMAQALDHIAKAAAASRSQTRRIRWIQLRAEMALAGREYRDIDVDLPKKVSGDTPERIQKRMAYHIAIKYELLDDLVIAAATLRQYEVLHRAKNTVESNAKADVNKTLADRFEQTITKATGVAA